MPVARVGRTVRETDELVIRPGGVGDLHRVGAGLGGGDRGEGEFGTVALGMGVPSNDHW